jgi:Ras-related protein Rab-8A
MSRITNVEEEDDDNQDILSYKIILLGDSTVGKTSLIIRFCDSKFNENCTSTVGVDTKTKYVRHNDKKIELDIWDTAGQERFKCLAKNCYQGADGIILMYDITQKKTFHNIKNWYNNIKDSMNINKVAMIILGNKSDLPNKEVTKEMGEKFSEQYGLELLETYYF